MKKSMFVFESNGGFGHVELKTFAHTESEAADHAAIQCFGRGAYARKGRTSGSYIIGHPAGNSGSINRIN